MKGWNRYIVCGNVAYFLQDLIILVTLAGLLLLSLCSPQIATESPKAENNIRKNLRFRQFSQF